jgi:predicted Zn-dependent peptidase
VLSDVLTKTAYDPVELDKERGVIIEEINMYEDDPASLIYEVLEAATFPDHPLGRSTLGPKANIKKFTPDDFRKYERSHQTPDRGLLVLAGKTDALSDDVIDEYAARFEGTSEIQAEPFTSSQTGPVLKVRDKATEQTHLGLALRGPSMQEDKASTTLRVLSQVLGGTMSSRLFVEVREKRGLAYYVRAMPDQYADTGALVITAGVTREKSVDALGAILTELKRLANGELSEDELTMHKDSIRGRLTLRWEDSMSLADFYGEQQLLLGKVKTTEQVLKDIEQVTVADLVDLTTELAQDDKLTVAVIGPHQASEYEKTLSFS